MSVVLCIIIIAVVINALILSNSAPEKAKSTLAHYLYQIDDLTPHKQGDFYIGIDKFRDFKTIYHTVENNVLNRTVYLSGLVLTNNSTLQFNAVVEVGYFKSQILSVTVDGKQFKP